MLLLSRYVMWPGVLQSLGTQGRTRLSGCTEQKSCVAVCSCSTSGFSVLHQLPELAQTHAIESAMPSNRLTRCRPLLLPPSIFPSIRVFPIF